MQRNKRSYVCFFERDCSGAVSVMLAKQPADPLWMKTGDKIGISASDAADGEIFVDKVIDDRTYTFYLKRNPGSAQYHLPGGKCDPNNPHSQLFNELGLKLSLSDQNPKYEGTGYNVLFVERSLTELVNAINASLTEVYETVLSATRQTDFATHPSVTMEKPPRLPFNLVQSVSIHRLAEAISVFENQAHSNWFSTALKSYFPAVRKKLQLAPRTVSEPTRAEALRQEEAQKK